MKNFRDRVRAKQPVLGAFIKSASHHVAEVMGHAQLDFLIADAEHGPFGIGEIDQVVTGARCCGLPCLVRTPDHTAGFINQCLDVGSAGIMAPHVTSADDAQALVAAVKYAAGQRGYSPSSRAGGYGTRNPADLRNRIDAETSLWIQIEDREALAQLDAIASLEAVDCLFVGRVDLAASLGVETADHPDMTTAIGTIAEAARRHDVALAFYVGSTGEIASLMDLGATIFACGSDQSYMLAQGAANRAAFDRAVSGKTD